MAAELTQEILQNLIYCENDRYFWAERHSGMFKAKKDCQHWNNRFAGKETFLATNGIGYRQTAIFGNHYLVHRLIWLFHNGQFPKGDIDHINGNRADNRLVNLRDVPRSINCRNQRKLNANKSGATGVSWCSQTKKWRATIKVNGKSLHLGRFHTINNAIASRKQAEKENGFHANHGRSF